MLAHVAVIWLCAQLGSVALVPATLWITSDHQDAAVCECGHGPHAMCPMHHKPAGPPTNCSIRSGDGSGTAVLTGLLSVIGLSEDSTSALSGAIAPPVAVALDAQPIGERPVPPDPPPPRA